MTKNNTTTKIANFSAKTLSALSLSSLEALYNSADTKPAQKEKVKAVYTDKVKEANTKIRADFITESAKGTAEEFLRKQFITAQRVKDDDNGLRTVEVNVRIPFTAIDAFMKKEIMPGKTLAHDAEYFEYVQRFADNIALYHGDMLSDENRPAKVSRLRYGTNKKGEARIIDFTAHDDKALYSQLDAIFMMILGKDTKIHPTNASLHFIKTSAGNAKRNVNGVMKIDRDKSILGLIQNVIAMRIEEKSFAVDTGVKGKKVSAPKQTKAEKKAEDAIAKKETGTPNALSGKVEEGKKESVATEKSVACARRNSVITAKPDAKTARKNRAIVAKARKTTAKTTK